MITLSEQAWSDVHLALKGRGFSVAATRRGVTSYSGTVKSGRLDVAIRLSIEDPLMTMVSPKVWVTDPEVLKRIGAHLNPDGSLCYADGGLEEYDPYAAGRAVLRVLESVKETLAIVLHGSAKSDVEREFLAYWKAENFVFTDLPAGFSGEAKLCPCDYGIIQSVATTPERVRRWSRHARVGDLKSVQVMQIQHPFNPLAGDGPGKSLASFRRWLEAFVPARDVARILASDRIDRSNLVLIAPNGGVLVSFKLPPVVQKAFARSTGGRRAHWMDRHDEEVLMSRGQVMPVALDELVNARLAAPSPLTGKSVAVVGCGAIGSRLILDLTRCGAGQGERPLLLVDPDVFAAANLARHVLPLTALGESKALAMAAEVRRLHPAAHVEGVSASALTLLQRLAAYDLLIDATGHSPLALRINHEAMIRRRSARQFPPVLHVSVHGNGAAVQSVLVTDDDHACLKCLRPDHGTLKASPLRQGVEIIKRPAACGDGGHIPYAAPAPAMAAALALQAALEWAADPKAPGPRVRTRVLAPELTSAPKDRNWPPQTHCPACRATVQTDE